MFIKFKMEIFIVVASVYNTCDKGMVGGEQYFRIRYNKGVLDWKQNIGTEITHPYINEDDFIPNQCNVNEKIIYCPVVSYSENQIVLEGCNGDKYYYFKNQVMIERFK